VCGDIFGAAGFMVASGGSDIKVTEVRPDLPVGPCGQGSHSSGMGLTASGCLHDWEFGYTEIP
jgi:hypothetical protein